MTTHTPTPTAGLSPEEELIAGLISDPGLRRIISSSLTEENFERGTGLRGAFRFAMAGPEWIERALRESAGTTCVQVQRLAPLGIQVSPQRAELLVRRIMDKAFDQQPVKVLVHRDDQADDGHADGQGGDGRDGGDRCDDERRGGEPRRSNRHADHAGDREHKIAGPLSDRSDANSTAPAALGEGAAAIGPPPMQEPSPRKHPSKIKDSAKARTSKTFRASVPSASVPVAPISPQEADAWALQVLGDPQLPGSAPKVAWCILTHIDRRTGIAFPSITTIAHEIAMSARTVIDALHLLCLGQHLAVERNSGKANRYRILLKAQPVRQAARVKGLQR